ncbi:MAG: S8 family serine peptidase, partial [Candidatus Hydrogenedentes bacterium]|nr:S8 family serine peptidase [Candidatus Hydrogenedentota bacterium]
MGRRTAVAAGILAIAVAAVWPPAVYGAPAGIPWRSPGASAAPESAGLDALRTRGEGRHLVLEFESLPDAAGRENLEANGIRLLRYLGGNAYFAGTAGGTRAAAVAGEAGVTAAYAVDTAWKMDPEVAAARYPEHALVELPGASGRGSRSSDEPTVAFTVLFHGDVALANAAVQAVERLGGVVHGRLEAVNGLEVWIPAGNEKRLAEQDIVQWVEFVPPPFHFTNAENRELTEVARLQEAPFSLDGSGVTVMVYDGGSATVSHVDLEGRAFACDKSPVCEHATHVAGTIAGSGAARPDRLYRGMAPAAEVRSYGWPMDPSLGGPPNEGNVGLFADYAEAVRTFGAAVANNSWGFNANTYNATVEFFDIAAAGGELGPPLCVVFANGNEQRYSDTGFETTGAPALAKNVISVGALNANDDSMTAFSSWGPTHDGRLKPDVCAPGGQSDGDGGVTSCAPDGGYQAMQGTSMAAPTVTGICALLFQDWRARRPGQPDPRNATIKALLAHNAVDLGRPGPDYSHGYGSVRAQATIECMRRDGFVEGAVDHGASEDYAVVIESAVPALKATLAWDDFPGTENTARDLINDLDLVAIAPDGRTRHLPWHLDPGHPDAPATRGPRDDLNNMEQVLVENPAPGTWTVRVTGASVPYGPQKFSLVATPSPAPSADWEESRAARAAAAAAPEPFDAADAQRWALIVGVGAYQDGTLGPLPNAVRDARAVRDALVSARGGFPAENVLLLVDDADEPNLCPTRNNLLAALTSWFKLPGDNDSLLLFYAGHGVESEDKLYLLPIDARMADVANTAVAYELVMEKLNASKAKRSIVILDACHSAKGRGAERFMTSAMMSNIELCSEGHITLASCKESELSHDYEEKGHGVFTWFLLDAIAGPGDSNGDGIVTALEVSTYTLEKTRRWAAGRGLE